MQFFAVVFALAATAVAAPGGSSDSWQCTFGEYECDYNGDGIKQCDYSGQWVEIGPCPAGTTCKIDAGNDLPYCFADNSSHKEKKMMMMTKRGGDGDDDDDSLGWCSTPGSYVCSPDCDGIEVCNSSGQLEWNGACPAGTSCQYLPDGAAGTVPFCVTDGWKI